MTGVTPEAARIKAENERHKQDRINERLKNDSPFAVSDYYTTPQLKKSFIPDPQCSPQNTTDKDVETIIAGIKHDTEKVRLDLVPYDAVTAIAEVLTFGANKYGERNWEKGINYNRLFRALMGHMWDWWRGAGPDAETGLSHLAHAGCCILFLLAYEARNMTHLDNRPRQD